MSSKAAPGVKRPPGSKSRSTARGPASYSSTTVQSSSLPSSTSASSNQTSNDGVTSQPAASDVSGFAGPLVMTPVSQLNPNRRLSRNPILRPEDNPVTFDPEHYNCDGSLKTMHTLPAFAQSYAQAREARYVRQREPLEREQELTIQQIFDKK